MFLSISCKIKESQCLSSSCFQTMLKLIVIRTNAWKRFPFNNWKIKNCFLFSWKRISNLFCLPLITVVWMQLLATYSSLNMAIYMRKIRGSHHAFVRQERTDKPLGVFFYRTLLTSCWLWHILSLVNFSILPSCKHKNSNKILVRHVAHM